jgi:hypothetical protein
LVEYYYNLKSKYKYKRGIDRYIFRKVLSSKLPDSICWNTEKESNTIPNIQHRFRVDEKKFRELIEEGRQNNSYHYLNYDKLHKMIDLLLTRDLGQRIDFAPNAFFNHVKILILQKWQREGKIDIGIKC